MNFGSLPLVSIVTPVYNGEKYLAPCIDSVLAQTSANWECVIVNNCSKDRTLEIAKEYASRDPRIRVHNNAEFLPAIDNWNYALRQISPASKYCKVLHADDWLFPEFLERTLSVAEANPSVGVVSSYRLCNNAVDCDGLPYPSAVTCGRDICRRHLLGKLFVFGSPSTLLIRSDLVRIRPQFYQPIGGETDVAACCDLLQECDFGFVHQVLSFTRVHSDSISDALGQLHNRLPEKLAILQRYGPVYLTANEFAQRNKQLMDEYWRVLRESTFEFRGKPFWDFHRKQTARLGKPLTKSRRAWWVLSAPFRILFKPLTITLVHLRQVTRRHHKSSGHHEAALGLYSAKQTASPVHDLAEPEDKRSASHGVLLP